MNIPKNSGSDINYFREVYRLSLLALEKSNLSASDKFTLRMAKKQILQWFGTADKSSAFTMNRELLEATIRRVLPAESYDASLRKHARKPAAEEEVSWNW